MIEQRDLTGDRLAAEIITLTGDAGGSGSALATAARAMARPDAARVIVDRILSARRRRMRRNDGVG